MSKNITSLVLEGGGLRGAYTAGALSWLLDNDIDFDNAYGISTGAIHLVNYLMKDKKRLFETSTRYINDKRSIGFRSFIRKGRIVDYDCLFDDILVSELKFDMEPIKKSRTNGQLGLYILERGRTEYRPIKNCSIQELKASTTLPILGKVIEVNGEHLLDGGITDMIPINRSVEDGCSRHLIITTKPGDYVRKPAKSFVVWLMKKVYPQCKNISEDYRIRHLNYQKQIALIKKLEEEKKAVYIFPSRSSKVTRLGGSFEELEKLYQLGYDDMEARRQEIIDLLK